MTDVKHFEGLLLARLEALRQSSEDSADSRDPAPLDQQAVGRVSRIDAMQRQAMAQAGESRRLNEISSIKAALKRIERDEFGDCLKCGEEISVKRLEINPAAALCIRCAK